MSGPADREAAASASRVFRRLAGGVLLGGLVRLVAATSRTVFEPTDTPERLQQLMPLIFTCWHGQGFLWFKVMNFEPARTSILVSRHADGEFVAGLAKSTGNPLIEGSGANYKEPEGTGGVAALRKMLRVLKRGENVGFTADVPPEPGRKASDGLALLARMSGRPVVPFHISSSRRRIVMSQWDRMQINYPFSRIGVSLGEPVWVPAEARDLSPYSARIASELDRTLARAFELADGAPPRA